MNVWVLVLDNEEGTKLRAFTTRAALDAALVKYCRERWDVAFMGEPPATVDDDELVRRYFEVCRKLDEDSYDGRCCELEG